MARQWSSRPHTHSISRAEMSLKQPYRSNTVVAELLMSRVLWACSIWLPLAQMRKRENFSTDCTQLSLWWCSAYAFRMIDIGTERETLRSLALVTQCVRLPVMPSVFPASVWSESHQLNRVNGWFARWKGVGGWGVVWGSCVAAGAG